MQTEHATTSHVVHFDVEGKFIADLARTRVEEGAWEHGLSLLKDSLDGLSHEMAVSLLKGEADLIGWSSDEDGIRLQQLEPTGELARQMTERLDYLYGTTFHYNGGYWAPYAQVVSWNREDYEWARTCPLYGHSLGYPDHERKQLWVLRSLFYANAPATDLVVYVPYPAKDRPSIVLCKPAPMPPLWYAVHRGDPEPFLAAAMQAGRKFAHRGAVFDKEDLSRAQADAEAAPSGEDEEDDVQPEAVEAAPVVEDARPSVSSLLQELEKQLTEPLDGAEVSGLQRKLEAAVRPVERKLSHDELDAVNDMHDRLHALKLQDYGRRVREQANQHGGYMDLPLLDENHEPFKPAQTLKVPRNPFLLWCLRHFAFEANGKERPQWSVVCPMGLKMVTDDPLHSDWMLGAGESIDNAYEHDPASRWDIVMRSAHSLRATITEEWTQAQFVVLAKGKERYFSGTVVKPEPNEAVPEGSIAVVPSAGPQYQLAMETACEGGGVLICDTGGKLAHLAIVGREFGCTVLMVPDATKRFREGQILSVDMDNGTVHSHLL